MKTTQTLQVKYIHPFFEFPLRAREYYSLQKYGMNKTDKYYGKMRVSAEKKNAGMEVTSLNVESMIQ